MSSLTVTQKQASFPAPAAFGLNPVFLGLHVALDAILTVRLPGNNVAICMDGFPSCTEL